jgi:hypothetical protein
VSAHVSSTPLSILLLLALGGYHWMAWGAPLPSDSAVDLMQLGTEIFHVLHSIMLTFVSSVLIYVDSAN